MRRFAGYRCNGRLLASVACWAVVLASAAHGAVVRYEFSINGTPLAPVDVRLYEAAMPRSTANFLNYVGANSWDGTFIHRRATLATSGVDVVQGGGFSVPATGLVGNNNGQLFVDIDQVSTFAPINDEPGGGVAGISNTRGTIAYAKSGPNTATSQWFFNLGDNSVLDDPNASTGGFAAFGRVLGNGLTTLDQIGNLPVLNLDGGLLRELPVRDQAVIDAISDAAMNNQPFNVLPSEVVILSDVRELDFADGDYNFDGTVDTADLSVWSNSFGSRTLAEADGNGDGVVDAADYTIWRDTFAASTAVGIPEPISAGLLLIATLVTTARGRRA